MNFDKLKKFFGVNPEKKNEPGEGWEAIEKDGESCAFKDLDSKSFSETKAHWETMLRNVSLSTSPLLLFDDMLIIQRKDFVSAAILYS